MDLHDAWVSRRRFMRLCGLAALAAWPPRIVSTSVEFLLAQRRSPIAVPAAGSRDVYWEKEREAAELILRCPALAQV